MNTTIEFEVDAGRADMLDFFTSKGNSRAPAVSEFLQGFVAAGRELAEVPSANAGSKRFSLKSNSPTIGDARKLEMETASASAIKSVTISEPYGGPTRTFSNGCQTKGIPLVIRTECSLR